MTTTLRIGAAALAMFTIFACAPLQAGNSLIGWWTFNERGGVTAHDHSGYGNHGALHGGCAFTNDGMHGSAVDFTCLNGVVSVKHSASLEPVTGTIEAWVNVPMLQDSDILAKTSNAFLQTGNSGGIYRGVYGLQIRLDGSAKAYVLNDDPMAAGPWTIVYAPPGSVTAGKWHHLALRWDGNRVAIFINGALKAHAPYLPVPGFGLSYGGTSSLVMGQATAWAGSSHHELLGRIDDVRFYNYALERSDTERLAAARAEPTMSEKTGDEHLTELLLPDGAYRILSRRGEPSSPLP